VCWNIRRIVEARARMQLGAAFGGLAIENSMLAAAHSAANPLTAHHGVVHGQAVGLMLPGVIEFNALLPEIESVYIDLALHAGLRSVHDLVLGLRKLLALAGLAESLASFGVTRQGISALADDAAKQWTAQFNPREIHAADFAKLYTDAL
jgi:alcohol dehydrogenase